MDKDLKYLTGFGNEFQTEDPRCPGALPVGQNSPQKCPYGLYAEQMSGTAMTLHRDANRRVWFYRIMPAVRHLPFKQIDNGRITNDFSKIVANPNQLRWSPFEIPAAEKPTDFVEGLATVCGNGHPSSQTGSVIYVYSCNRGMGDKCFNNSDGDLLIVPQQGALKIKTEFGRIFAEPSEVVVIQPGMRFSVEVDGPSRGYVLEVFGNHFTLPNLGPIGANGLANARDFKTPTAWYEDIEVPGYKVVNKFQGNLFEATQDRSPFNVVAWHGNYVPYKYNLKDFNAINTVTYDHCDPSIFSVLTCQSLRPGVAVADFLVIPPRWNVAEHTYRPPYYHRNCISEFSGVIEASDQAKAHGVIPGSANLHNTMTPHGSDTAGFEQASNEELKAEYMLKGTLLFMFETSATMVVTDWANKISDPDYYKGWQTLKKHFDPSKP